MAVRAIGLVGVLLLLGACGSGGLSEAEQAWCVENHQVVVDTMDVLYPYHWEGNEAAKEETLPIFERMEAGTLSAQEGQALLAEIIRRYWPEEYEAGCRKAFADR